MVVHTHGHADFLLQSVLAKGLVDHETHQPPASSMETYFWVGICLMLVGNTLSAVGLLVQKYAHQDPDTKWTSYITSPKWLCGFSIFILAHILCFASLALGPQAVLSGISCWSTVVTFVLAPIFLGETVTVFRFMSVSIMIFGCSWVILSGPRVYQVFTVPMMMSMVQNVLFQVLTGLAIMYLIINAAMAAFSKQIPRLSAFQYTTVAAIVGWYSVLNAKITSGLVFSSWHHTLNQFDRWESWVMVVTMLVLAVTNLHFLNMALSIGDAVYVVPVYEAMAILGQTVIGGIFFREFQHMTVWAHINFWFGLLCIIAGVICLAQRGPETDFFQYEMLSPKSGMSPMSTPKNATTPMGSESVTDTSPRPPDISPRHLSLSPGP